MQKESLHIKKNTGGFSLIEIIISSALILLLATLFTNAILAGEEGAVTSGTRTRANLIAEEGLEAVRNMRDGAFTSLVDGTYGVVPQFGTWVLGGPSTVVDIFTRTVTIQTIDATTKQVTSTVTWPENGQRVGSVTLVNNLIDTSLLVPQAKSLQVDVSGGHISAGSKLQGIKIKNIGASTITLSTTTVSWVGGLANYILSISSGGTVWSSTGPGYPQAQQPSGGSEGLVPIVMSTHSANPINDFSFDKNINGTTFTIKFIMSDNSSTTVSLPPL